jgi:GWxTD domain-containing protein
MTRFAPRPLIAAIGMLPAAMAVDAIAQPQVPSAFNVDIVSFRGPVDGSARTDVYLAVPFETLQFTEYNGTMVAEYSVTVTVRDTAGRRLYDSTYRRTVVEDDYAVTRGKTGKSDNSVRRHTLRPGSYRIEVVIRDVFGKRDHSLTRKILVPAFDGREADMSSVMLVSDVEQRGQRYSITPYIGDVIWSAEQPLFLFVEVYAREARKRCAIAWDISATDGRTLANGMGEIFTVEAGAAQTFAPISIQQRLIPGTYQVRVRLHPVGSADDVDTTKTLAERSRPYIVPRSMSGNVLTDLTKAIKQLLYVADQADIDMIQGGASEAERLTRFEEYWKRQDPTPTTVRNEAFEEYYGRVEQANRRFKSYTEGWLTDMGRVYIIYGEPTNVERFTGQNGVSMIVRWTYANSMSFTFEDTSGFGDYRSRTPLPAGAKYTYRR